jgi:hypothetical protein
MATSQTSDGVLLVLDLDRLGQLRDARGDIGIARHRAGQVGAFSSNPTWSAIATTPARA